MVRPEERYASLISYYAGRYGIDPDMIRRQIAAESSFRPQVASPAGAVGLMQFMPGTFAWAVKEMRAKGVIPPDYEVWIKNPEDSINVGCWYDRWLFDRFGEIPDPVERWRFALASYNAGRGSINSCLALARAACGAPASFAEWERAGRQPGPWQEWRFASRFLALVTGDDDAPETIAYVAKILPAERG